MVKEYLSQKGFAFKERDISRDAAAAQEMINHTGQRGVPVTVINGQKVIIGFDRAALEDVLVNVSRQHSLFGAAIADTNKVKAMYGSGITAGAYVGRVKSGSSAEGIGIQSGDIILEINHTLIYNAADMENLLSRLQKGERISLVLLRGGQTMTLEGRY